MPGHVFESTDDDEERLVALAASQEKLRAQGRVCAHWMFTRNADGTCSHCGADAVDTSV